MSHIQNNRACSKDGIANMIRILAKQRDGIQICHINAQSLKNKMDEFGFIFQNSGIDIICVSETWFDDCVGDLSISLDDYNVCRADRVAYAGGVAIYVKKGITFTVICKSGDDNFIDDEDILNSSPNLVEYIFIEVISEGRKLLIGSVYRPNKQIPMQRFNKSLERLTICYDDVIIAGDFNSNLLVDNSLYNNMISLGFSSPNTSTPTHFTATNNTLLDLFFVSNTTKILLYDQLSASCFSKHDLIYMSYNFVIHVPEQSITYRDFTNIDYGLLEEEFFKINWNSLFYMISVDDQNLFLENNIRNLFNIVVPLKTKTISPKKKPWFSTLIKEAILRRDIAYGRWKRFKTTHLHEEYKTTRRNANKLIKKAKSDFYAAKFSSAIGSKKTWKTIREIGIGKVTRSEPPIIDANELNDKFVNIPMVVPDISYYQTNNILHHEEFSFNGVSELEVLTSCFSIKSNAVGADEINPKFLKIILPQLLKQITFFFNKIITTSCYPTTWKNAKIIPVPKSTSDYRPIAILPFLSKAFERIIHTQITHFLDTNNLLNDRQSGFRKKNGCITALVDVVEDIRRDIDSGYISFLVLLDHSKAFDTVDYNILCHKLKYLFKFSNNATRLISSYLTNRFQYVDTNTRKSNYLPVMRGVPQGSILGPLLFSLYSNDLPLRLEQCKIRMYADDVQIYIGCNINEIDQCVSTLNQELHRVYLWASANGLGINPKKSKCIVIQKRLYKTNITPVILINNELIEIVNSSKNLGIIINNSLTWSDHINYACGRTFSMLRTLWQTQYCTPIHIRKVLAKTYLIPILLYGCELFANCDRSSMDKMNIVFKSVIRYVYGLNRYSHTASFTNQLYGISFYDLLKTRVLIFIHKIIYTRQPAHLYERLIFSRSTRGRRLICFRHHSLVSEWQFFIYAIRLWNLIPHSSQETSSAQLFKKKLFLIFSISN